MVKRRKVLIGAGSLLAGGAAATGTGALSQGSVDRDLTGTVETDGVDGAYVGLRPGDDFPGNEQAVYAELGENGELMVDFEDLNADSVSSFHQVFRISNRSNQDWSKVWITTTSPVLDFYFATQTHNSIVGESNARSLDSNADDPSLPPDGFMVGITVDLDNSGLEDGQEFGGGDKFTIHVEA